ncbi:MAG: PQQ-binding-like beta-propeller repeat protein, partial [Planctomycetales bacterium]|nr:PQQ-binding-like beta-propeller repeat protein [Planctomycetales bacterium]
IDYQSDDGDVKKAYCTCQIIEHDGQVQLISPSAAETIAYDPSNGDVLWRVHHGGMNTATRPVYADGLVFITVGDGVGEVKPTLLAVRPDRAEKLNGQPRIAWSTSATPPKRPSPLVVGSLLFTINDDGVAMCLEATTGDVVWRKRIAGNYRASPICANGKIYFASLEGEVTVIEAAREFKQLASNRLDNGFQSSPAVQGNSLYLRSIHDLYCFE